MFQHLQRMRLFLPSLLRLLFHQQYPMPPLPV
jgi:hypothetical protein